MSGSTILNKVNLNNSGRKRDIKFSITSITFNISFLILNFPFVLSSLIPNNILSLYQTLSLLAFFSLLTYLNHGTVFFINYSINSMFIEEFDILFNIRSEPYE